MGEITKLTPEDIQKQRDIHEQRYEFEEGTNALAADLKERSRIAKRDTPTKDAEDMMLREATLEHQVREAENNLKEIDFADLKQNMGNPKEPLLSGTYRGHPFKLLMIDGDRNNIRCEIDDIKIDPETSRKISELIHAQLAIINESKTELKGAESDRTQALNSHREREARAQEEVLAAGWGSQMLAKLSSLKK